MGCTVPHANVPLRITLSRDPRLVAERLVLTELPLLSLDMAWVRQAGAALGKLMEVDTHEGERTELPTFCRGGLSSCRQYRSRRCSPMGDRGSHDLVGGLRSLLEEPGAGRG